jgi:hypothetical protein
MKRHRRRISPNHPCLHRPTSAGRAPAPTPRTLHLIDVDNLLGDPTTTNADDIDLVFRSYRHAARFTDGDHAVVATGHHADHVLAIELAWPQVQHRRARGPDGADLALLEAADWAATSGRFERVVIGSGDRIFLVALDRLRAADIQVEFVARARSLATALAVRARGSIHYLRLPALAPAG